MHRLAHFDAAVCNLAADTKGLIDFVARMHGAEIAIGFVGAVVAHLGSADGTRRLGAGLVLSARAKQRGNGCCKNGGTKRVHDEDSLLVSKVCQPPPSAL